MTSVTMLTADGKLLMGFEPGGFVYLGEETPYVG